MVVPLVAAAATSPWITAGIPAVVSGLASYFGADANKQAAEQAAEQERQKLEFQKQQYADKQKSNASARGIIGSQFNTTGYGTQLNYVNPYQSAMDTSINAYLSGALTPAEVTQQGKDIATGQQSINAGAATMGLPAGARAALNQQNVSGITGNYANMASARIGQGISAANTAASTGANIAGMNYQSGLQNFLAEQEAQRQKAQLLAGYQ